MAEEIEQIERDATYADEHAAIWVDGGTQFARLREQQAVELRQLDQAAEAASTTVQQASSNVLSLLRLRSRPQ